MGDKSSIEWTDATWNPVVGCTIVSPGCTNCYAMAQAAHIQRLTKGNTHYAGTTREVNGHQVWTGNLQQAPDHIWTMPLKWKRPRRIFVNSMGDLFHESVPDHWIGRAFAIMARCPQHTFQILTKRAKRMREFMARTTAIETIYSAACQTDDSLAGRWQWPLPNVQLGVSCEDQTRFDERVADLYNTPASIRFFSFEPLLGHIIAKGPLSTGRFHWAITGGESGPSARPMHSDWAGSIRDQCAAAGVSYFHKQNGEWLDADQLLDRMNAIGHVLFDGSPWQPIRPLGYEDSEKVARIAGCKIYEHHSSGQTFLRLGKSRAGRLLDGREHNAMPQVK